MYEIGLRHSFNKPMISICQSGEKLPFDLAAERTVFFDIGDLNSVDEAKKKISNAARAVTSGQMYKSSVVRILEHSDLFGGEYRSPEPRSLLETMEEMAGAIQEIQSDLFSLELSVDGIEVENKASVDPILENKLDELLRLFSLVGPTDISSLAEAVKLYPSKK